MWTYYVPIMPDSDGPWSRQFRGRGEERRWLYGIDDNEQTWVIYDDGERDSTDLTREFFERTPANQKLDFNPFDCDG